MRIGKHHIINEKDMEEIMKTIHFVKYEVQRCVLYSDMLEEQGKEDEDQLPEWQRDVNKTILDLCLKAEEIYDKNL